VLDTDATTLFILFGARADPARVADRRRDRLACRRAHRAGCRRLFSTQSFGNAPELIIGLFAIADGCRRWCAARSTGSVVSNMLLVLGAAMIAGGDGKVDARSLRLRLRRARRRDRCC
jgi:calcium/proton exchanger cax